MRCEVRRARGDCRRRRKESLINFPLVRSETTDQRLLTSSPTLNRAGFSLIEILVTVGLLSFIILGLLAMFIQTQKAFRGSMKQTDVMAAGRAIMDMLGRELSQMTPSQMARTTNFLVEVEPTFAKPPLLMGLPGTSRPPPPAQECRTNVVQRFFFLSLVNQDWVGTGYVVVGEYNNGMGTLYRWTGNARNFGVSQLSSNFLNLPLSNFSRVADGIVHLRVRAFATNGFPIVGGFTNAAWFRTNALATGTYPVKNTSGFWDGSMPDQVDCYFNSNAVPASVELELGILEPNITDRAKSIPSPAPPPIPPAAAVAARDYLSNHVAQVHLFRQRVPVRNVDFNAYQ